MALAVGLPLLPVAVAAQAEPTVAVRRTASPAPEAGLTQRLAEAFRIDLRTVDVSYDYFPRRERVRGTATLTFTMRPGQDRALFHFNPRRDRGQRAEQRMIKKVVLDGRPVAPSQLRRIRTSRAAEPAFELRQRLAADTEHTLEVSWAGPKPADRPGWLFTNFDDTEGPDDEIESLWPTVSSPEEQARHRIEVRVHGARRYTALGSGTATKQGQTWVFDTGREVASHTVFFAAVPRREVRVSTFKASGIPVRIVSDRPPAKLRRARGITRQTMRQLHADFGPFPMPSMQILLTRWGSGMEYYGATRTGLGSLRHELGHMYFGAATVNRTWRDTWFDESAVVWWDERRRQRPVPPGFTSNIAGGRSVVAPGFDESAYGAGARILDSVAQGMGGDRAMVEFLADLHARRAFAPFTTRTLIDDILAAQDQVDRRDLERWLYTP